MEIIFDNVSYSSKLKKINLSFKSGNIYFILNDNNILKLISKSIECSSGEILLNNKSINEYKINKVYSKKICLVKKNPYDCFNDKTVLEELNSILKIYNFKKEEYNNRINVMLKLFDFKEDILYKKSHELSLIDAKKVSFMMGLIYNPSIILLDDYTLGLTSSDKSDFERIIKMLKNKYNKIIIISCSDIDFMYKCGEYYLVFNKSLIKEGKRDILRDKSILESICYDEALIDSFIKEYNSRGRRIYNYNNILDLIKGIYRDIF